MAHSTYEIFNKIGFLETAQNATRSSDSDNVIDMVTRQKFDQTPVVAAAPELNGMVSSKTLASLMTNEPEYDGKTPAKTPGDGMSFGPFTT
jgi:hypothetical protein